MLWKFKMPFEGYIEASSSLAEARQTLIEKIKADPASFISKLEPAEPTAHTMLDLGKRVFGISTK